MHQAGQIYSFGGITLRSEIALPELPWSESKSLPSGQVSIRLGETCAPWRGAVEVDPGCFASPKLYLLQIPGVASYQVTNGTDIVINLAPAARMPDVRAYLLGTVFMALCQQRNLLPLHASAVQGRKGVVAFLGRSGQGKSSLAAHLADRGFPVVADDACLIDPAPPGPIMVTPIAPWLKLWRNSLESLGRNENGLERVFSDEDKYRVPLTGDLGPQPMAAAVFLSPENSSVEATSLEEISRLEAIPLMMNLTHQAYLLEATGQREESFRRCGRVLSQIKAFRLDRPWGLEHLKSTVDAVQQLLV